MRGLEIASDPRPSGMRGPGTTQSSAWPKADSCATPTCVRCRAAHARRGRPNPSRSGDIACGCVRNCYLPVVRVRPVSEDAGLGRRRALCNLGSRKSQCPRAWAVQVSTNQALQHRTRDGWRIGKQHRACSPAIRLLARLASLSSIAPAVTGSVDSGARNRSPLSQSVERDLATWHGIEGADRTPLRGLGA